MIIRMWKPTKTHWIAVYMATDWCIWPVLVFNPSPLNKRAVLLSLQWLRWGVGVTWLTKQKG